MFSKILKEKRKELGLTQQEVADHLNVTRQTISNWEVGKSYPDIPTLVEISNFYNLSLDYMLKGDEQFMEKVKKDTKLFKYLKIGTVVLLLLIFGPNIIKALFEIGVQVGRSLSYWF
ncbi:helix-turn-helix domain-containing protein [Vagococcus carniphilus]|uniref:helix-turn-helix domain-containing protein n=1 Tax=Vagococcus carniphilus TaxID=218144 RepID=UPI003B590F00